MAIVGLDRETAKNALSNFMADKSPTANQIDFLNMLRNHLASQGWIEPARLYRSPFTDLHPYGMDGLFDDQSVIALLAVLQKVRRNAMGFP